MHPPNRSFRLAVVLKGIALQSIILKQELHQPDPMTQDIWPHLTNLKWIHSASAGVEKLLFPELIKSKVVVTNAKASGIICIALVSL